MRSHLFCFVVLLVIPLSISNAASDVSGDNLTEGNNLYQQEKYEEAISFFDTFLKNFPNSTDAIGKTGDSFFQLNNHQKAREYYSKVMEIDPKKTDDSGKLYIEKLLELDPNNIEALYTKGKLLAFFNNTMMDAELYFDKILEINPRHADALHQKGIIYFQLDQFEKAISFFDQAVEINPNHPDSLSSKGYALAKLDKLEEANVYVDKALQISPNSPDVLYRKGSVLLVEKNANDAFTYFYKALKIDPDHYYSQIKLKLTAASLPVKKFNGYAEAKTYDSNGYLVGYVKANRLMSLYHTTVDEMINEWPVTQIIERDGKKYEVHQKEQTVFAPIRYMYGGANFYGVYMPPHSSEPASLILTNDWMFQVDSGDTIKLVHTAFTPVT